MVIYDFDPTKIPDDILKGIGLVIVSATETEAIMQICIGALLGVDNVDSVAICAQMPFRLKDDVIRTLNELKAPSASELDKLDDILDRIASAMNIRNAIAHSSFPIDPETKKVYRFKEKARGALTADLVEVNQAELTSIATEVHESGLALQSFMISRGLYSRERQAPLKEPISRRKGAREGRRTKFGDDY